MRTRAHSANKHCQQWKQMKHSQQSNACISNVTYTFAFCSGVCLSGIRLHRYKPGHLFELPQKKYTHAKTKWAAQTRLTLCRRRCKRKAASLTPEQTTQHFHFSRSFFCFGSSGSFSCSLSTQVLVSWLLLSPAPPPTLNSLPFYCTKQLQFCLISYSKLICLDLEQDPHFLEVRLMIAFVLGGLLPYPKCLINVFVPNKQTLCIPKRNSDEFKYLLNRRTEVLLYRGWNYAYSLEFIQKCSFYIYRETAELLPSKVLPTTTASRKSSQAYKILGSLHLQD